MRTAIAELDTHERSDVPLCVVHEVSAFSRFCNFLQLLYFSSSSLRLKYNTLCTPGLRQEVKKLDTPGSKIVFEIVTQGN